MQNKFQRFNQSFRLKDENLTFLFWRADIVAFSKQLFIHYVYKNPTY